MMPLPGGCGLLAPAIVPGVWGALLLAALLGNNPCCCGPPLLLLPGWETPCCAAFIIFLYLLLRFWNQILTCNTQNGWFQLLLRHAYWIMSCNTVCVYVTAIVHWRGVWAWSGEVTEGTWLWEIITNTYLKILRLYYKASKKRNGN